MAWDILSKYSFKNTSFKARLSFIIGLIFSIFLILIFILQYLFFRATLESDAMELLYGQFTSTTKFLEKVSLDYPFDSDKVSAI